MNRVRGGRLVALACFVLVGAGCRPAVVAPRPPAVAAGKAVTSVEAVRRLLAEREGETRTLTATFKLTFRRAEGSAESSRGALVVARPDRLRLQVFSFGMLTAYDYTVRGDRFRVRRPLDGFERIGRFGEIEGEDALGADLRPLFLRSGDLAGARVDETADAYVVRLGEPAGERAIEVTKADGTIVRESLLAGGEPRIVTEYSDHRAVDGVPLPFAIRVAYPAKGVRLEIDVERYTRNQPAADDVFAF